MSQIEKKIHKTVTIMIKICVNFNNIIKNNGGSPLFSIGIVVVPMALIIIALL